jgi:geranyl-CoA carboxylase alpha subunit
VRLTGHALEVRLYAESPAQNFLPQSGMLALWSPPGHIRVDHGLHPRDQAITPFYDPMIAKLIAHGGTREDARRRLISALEQTAALGISTNRGFLIDLLSHEEFAAGKATTAFIPQHFASIPAQEADTDLQAISALLWFERGAAQFGHDPASAWSSNGSLAHPVKLGIGAGSVKLAVTVLGPDRYRIDAAEYSVTARSDNRLRIVAAGIERDVTYAFAGEELHLCSGAADLSCRDLTWAPPAEAEGAAERELRAPMNGRIVAVLAAAGDQVKKGQRLVVMEAMKMQHEMVARVDATVDALPVRVGDQVATRQLLAALTPVQP